MVTPAWLPALIALSTYNGSWEKYLEAIYQGFRGDFIDSHPALEGTPCTCKRYPMSQGKEGTFWHLISEGDVEDDRMPDLRRCERIRWPRAMIERLPAEGVRKWRTRRGNDKRIVLATEDFSYVVVLADRGKYVLLWTAYVVDREHRRRKLMKEAEQNS